MGNDPYYYTQPGHVWYQWIRLLIAHLLTLTPGVYDFFTIFYEFYKGSQVSKSSYTSNLPCIIQFLRVNMDVLRIKEGLYHYFAFYEAVFTQEYCI